MVFLNFYRRYSCYKRLQGYNRWDFYTGNGNPGVVAEVRSMLVLALYDVFESG